MNARPTPICARPYLTSITAKAGRSPPGARDRCSRKIRPMRRINAPPTHPRRARFSHPGAISTRRFSPRTARGERMCSRSLHPCDPKWERTHQYESAPRWPPRNWMPSSAFVPARRRIARHHRIRARQIRGQPQRLARTCRPAHREREGLRPQRVCVGQSRVVFAPRPRKIRRSGHLASRACLLSRGLGHGRKAGMAGLGPGASRQCRSDRDRILRRRAHRRGHGFGIIRRRAIRRLRSRAALAEHPALAGCAPGPGRFQRYRRPPRAARVAATEKPTSMCCRARSSNRMARCPRSSVRPPRCSCWRFSPISTLYVLRFPHQREYFDAPSAQDFTAWRDGRIWAGRTLEARSPPFIPSATVAMASSISPSSRSYTPNASNDTRLEATAAAPPPGRPGSTNSNTPAFTTPSSCPASLSISRMVTPANCAVLFPETVALTGRAPNHFAMIFL